MLFHIIGMEEGFKKLAEETLRNKIVK